MKGKKSRDKRPTKANTDLHHVSDLRIVLLGKSVSENSGVGNFILGRAAFDSEAPPDVVERVRGRLKDRRVMVINSPQLLQTNISDHQITQTVRECVSLCDPGPHAFILVLQYNDFTEEDMRRVKQVLEKFSEEAIKRTIVLTTDEETPRAKGAPVKANEFIQQLTEECGGGLIQHKNDIQFCSSEIFKRIQTIWKQQRVGSSVNREDSGSVDSDLKEKREEQSGLTQSDVVRIVMMGKTGVGKSATGNTILRKTAFKSKLTSRSVTRECQKETAEFNRRQITVIDTPGLFDTGVDNIESCKEIVMCISMAAPGPHVFLLVIQLGQRFTQEEKDAVKMIQETFGDKSRMYTMVLFTRGDELGETRAEEFIEDDDSLKNLIQKCGKRYHVFNNKTEDQMQVSELLEKIDRMVAGNGGSFYTNEMFQLVEKNIKEEQERIMKEKEEEHKRKEEELKTKYEAKIEKMKKEQESKGQEMQNKLRKSEEEFKKKEEEIKKEMDDNKREELQRKLEKQKKEFEEENKRKEKALGEQQNNFIKYLEEQHTEEKQKLQKEIKRETREQAEREYRIKLDSAEEQHKIEVANALKEAEEKHKMEVNKALQDAEEKYKKEVQKVLQDAKKNQKTVVDDALKNAKEKHKIEVDKVLQDAKEKHKREVAKAVKEAKAEAFEDAEAELPYRSKYAREFGKVVPFVGGAIGGAIGGFKDFFS